MLLPAVVYVILFCYAPMYGLQIAFKNYKVSLGISKSPWVGFRNFTDFFQSYYFGTLLKNTLVLSIYSLIVGFPIPIIVALVLNEMKGKFKKVTQTMLYSPQRTGCCQSSQGMLHFPCAGYRQLPFCGLAV